MLTPSEIEAAPEDQTAAILSACFAIIHPEPPPGCEPVWRAENPKQPIYHAWKTREIAFSEAIRAKAFVDAALLCIPSGWFLYGCGEQVKPIIYRGDTHDHIGWWAEVQWRDGGGRMCRCRDAKGLPLAIASASLRAMHAHLSRQIP